MIGNRFDYSIELARRIYRQIPNDEEGIKVVHNAIESYYKEKGIEFIKKEYNDVTMPRTEYRGGGQTITFSLMSGKPSAIILNQYEWDANNLIEKAYYEKELFGLPVFTLAIMQDSPLAMIHLLNRETYLSFDTPEEQAFRRRMNALDDIIESFGGNDIWQT